MKPFAFLYNAVLINENGLVNQQLIPFLTTKHTWLLINVIMA